MIRIRPALAKDETIIKHMIRDAQLDPTSLKWQNFLIAEIGDEIAGIGQVKQLPGCQEIGSLVVMENFRGQGIATHLMLELEKGAEFPLYLLCPAHRETFYARIDYTEISWWQAPAILKLKLSLSWIFRLFGIRVLVMRKNQPESE